MELSARKISQAEKHSTDCAVTLVFPRKKLSDTANELDKASGGLLSAALKNGAIRGNAAESVVLQMPAACRFKQVLLITCAAPAKLDDGAIRELSTLVCAGLGKILAKSAAVYVGDLAASSHGVSLCETLGRDLARATYSYKRTVSKPKPGLGVKKVVLDISGLMTAGAATKALRRGQDLGAGINVARELGNLPGNICTPSYLASEARKLARESDQLSTQVLNEKQMSALGMGSLLSVSAGSAEPAKLVVMNYKGGKSGQRPVVLVGKGITFDTGGISLKPGGKMDEMKYDMCGAASVMGTFNALVRMQLPINVVGIIAAAENMPSSTATKPGDVVTSMSGKTIEILNTDAEGRLVLCDALTYAERFKPAAVIDIATLTGACVVALGAHASALYSNNDALAEQLLTAGTATHDRAWRMPLWDDYQKQINTPFADVANIGGPGGGSITAACFLARFAEEYPWAHLDIAGSAWNSAPKAATGRPVSLLTRYLMDRAGV